MTWREIANKCQEVYGIYVDWDEEFFICPECGEPLYKIDFEDHDWLECPICEFDWEDEE